MNGNNTNQNGGNNQPNMMGNNGFSNNQVNGYYNQNGQMNAQNNGMNYNNGQINQVNNMNSFNGQMTNQMYNYNNGMVQQGYNGNTFNNVGSVSLNKNVTKGLVVVLTIIFAVVMGLIVGIFNKEEELVCSYEGVSGNISYAYTYTYSFKGDKLRKEHVNLTLNLGNYYDIYKDEYIREAEETFANYIEADFDFKTSSKNQNLLIDVNGSGKSVIDYYKAESFSNLPNRDFILDNIDERYVCK